VIGLEGIVIELTERDVIVKYEDLNDQMRFIPEVLTKVCRKPLLTTFAIGCRFCCAGAEIQCRGQCFNFI
jgi:hypothetical protein